MRTFLIVLLTALLTLIGGGAALQEGLIPGMSGGDGTCTETKIVKKYEEGTCPISETGNDCTTPRGTSVSHGTAVLSFASEKASVEEGCISKTSICNDGEFLNGEVPFDAETCTLDTPQNCTINGFQLAHGATKEFYSESRYVNGERLCNSSERACSDGITDGDEAHIYPNCYEVDFGSCEPVIKEEPKPEPVVKPTPKVTTKPISRPVVTQPTEGRQPNCPNPFGGYRWEPGQTGTAYRNANVSFGSTCESVSIVCAFGSIRYGTKSNPGAIVGGGLSQSCSVLPASPCSSACGTVPHGETVTTYAQALIPHGNGQVCSDTQTVSTCSNGNLSPSGGASCSCDVAPPSPCTAPNGQTVPHNGSLTLYKYPSVQALPGDGIDVCERQWRQCINGGFHDWNGNRSDFVFRYASCEVLDPPAGGGPGGQGIPQGG